MIDAYHLLHLSKVGPITVHKERLVVTPLCLLRICAAQWIGYKWDQKCSESQSELRFFVQNSVPGHWAWACLHIPAWIRIKVLEDFSVPCINGYLLLHQSVSGCIIRNRSTCDFEMLITLFSRGYHALLVLDDEPRCWFNNIVAKI